MKKILMLVLVMGIAYGAAGQKWKLKEAGVGLIVEDENYDKKLRIEKEGKEWDFKELYENGALAGKYKGNQLFAAWIQGPHTDEFKNENGLILWNYKYVITYPDGTTFESGPHGFYVPGFTYFGIKPNNKPEGKWKIDWYIVHRDTKETKHIATSEFNATYGKVKKAEKSDWEVKEIGVGLIDRSEYDSKLKIIKKGDKWSQKELYEKGYLAGRDKVFGAWIEGPHTKTYTNSNGIAVWMCKFILTNPQGKWDEFGPYGFYIPGFYTTFINVGGNGIGKWSIEFLIVNRDTRETRSLGTREFTITE